MTHLVNQSVKIGLRLLFITFASQFLFAKILYAQQTGSYDSLLIYEAETIEILDVKPRSDILSLFPVQELTQKEIEELSVINVAEAVKLLPGVMLKDYGGIGGLKTISVRSLSSSHTTVFIDGIKYSNSQSGQIDLGRFSTDRLTEIEVLSSGISTDLTLPAQAYLTTSSLYLQTQGASIASLNQLYAVESKLSLGSFGYRNMQLGAKWQPSEKVLFTINADQMDAGGEYDYNFQNGTITEELRRQNTDVHASRFETNLKLNITDISTLNIKGYGYFSERGLPGAVIVGYYDKSKERLWNHDTFLQGSWNSKAFESLDYVVRAKYAYSHTRYQDPNFFAGIIDTRYTEHEAYSSLSVSQRISPYLIFSGSSDITWSTLNSARFSDSPERLSWLSVVAFQSYYFDLELNANLLWSKVEEKSFDEAVDRHRSDLLPAFSVGYWITEQLHATLSYKKSLRLPSFNEMYYPRFGNTDLKPEYTTQFNLGLGYQKGRDGFIESLSLNADLYRLNIRDKIIAVPRGSLFQWSVVNLNRVETTGLELNGKIKVNVYGPLKTSLSGGYTYQEALEKTPSSSPFYQASTYNKQIAYTPKVTASVMSTVYYRDLSFSWQIAYVGSKYISGEQNKESFMPDYTTHDFNVIYNFDLFSVDSSIKAELNNVFDKRYEVIKSYPMPGRSFRISFSVQS
jgi:outer membrane cobalamin receptor